MDGVRQDECRDGEAVAHDDLVADEVACEADEEGRLDADPEVGASFQDGVGIAVDEVLSCGPLNR